MSPVPHAPTPADLKEHRKKGENRFEKLEKEEKEKERQALRDATKLEKDPEDELRKFLDVDHIAVIDENPTEVSYALPIKIGAKFLGAKLDRLGLVVRVAKADRIVSALSVRVLDNVRFMLLVNVKPSEFTAGFVKPDPAHGPVMNRFEGTLDASFLFKKIAGKVDATRSDFSWVTPYDERFKVQIGPLKAIGF